MSKDGFYWDRTDRVLDRLNFLRTSSPFDAVIYGVQLVARCSGVKTRVELRMMDGSMKMANILTGEYGDVEGDVSARENAGRMKLVEEILLCACYARCRLRPP